MSEGSTSPLYGRRQGTQHENKKHVKCFYCDYCVSFQKKEKHISDNITAVEEF
jgi:hypothetical protein